MLVFHGSFVLKCLILFLSSVFCLLVCLCLFNWFLCFVVFWCLCSAGGCFVLLVEFLWLLLWCCLVCFALEFVVCVCGFC